MVILINSEFYFSQQHLKKGCLAKHDLYTIQAFFEEKKLRGTEICWELKNKTGMYVL